MRIALICFFYFARVVVPALFFFVLVTGLLWHFLFSPTETCTKTADHWTICRIH